MNKNITEMSSEEIENLKLLGFYDTFEFTCKACGKCCKKRTDLILTPYDIFRIAGYLGRSALEILARYCEVYEGRQSHIPIVRVLPVPPSLTCPFLRNNKCSVNEKKPGVCRVYPLARIYKNDSDGSRYYLNGASCKHEPKTITVKEWIGDFASEEAEQVGKVWSEIIHNVHHTIQSQKLKELPEVWKRVFDSMFDAFYAKYDIQQPFIPQLERNYEELKKIMTPVAD